jgi:hypothetical protein
MMLLYLLLVFDFIKVRMPNEFQGKWMHKKKKKGERGFFMSSTYPIVFFFRI